MLTQDKINELREEYRLYLGSRCEIHPDFFPDECCGTTDWWISKIETILKERDEELVEKIKELKHEIQQDEIPLGNEQWKEGHTKCLEEVINLIKQSK